MEKGVRMCRLPWGRGEPPPRGHSPVTGADPSSSHQTGRPGGCTALSGTGVSGLGKKSRGLLKNHMDPSPFFLKKKYLFKYVY